MQKLPAAGTGLTTPTAPPAIATSPPPEPGRPIPVNQGTLIRLSGPANTVFIANPDVADVTIKTPSLVYLIAKAPGETVLYAVDAADRVLLNAPVRVEHDLSRVRRSLGSIVPGENVVVSSVDNSLVLNGTVSSAGRAEKVRSLAASIAGETKGTVVNRLGVSTPNQVNIRVKVAEVSRDVLKAIGVNWSKLAGGNVQFETHNPTTGGQIAVQNIITTAFGARGARITAMLDALAQENLVTTLAEPNLTATNGQSASFLAGGSFPVPAVGSAGINGQAVIASVDFKPFGVSLDVTPTIIDAEHLSLRIRTEVSELSSAGAVTINGQFISALTQRRAETTVELGSGESFALAGLLQNSDTQNVSKVPMLGDIPILGQLFRSQQFQRKETELVIIVTPYLVQPAPPTVAKLALPTDGFVPAHDVQQFISGGLYRQTLPPPARGPAGPGGQGLIGPVGFRLD